MSDMNYPEKLEVIKEKAAKAFELGASEVTLHCYEIGSEKGFDYTTTVGSLDAFYRTSQLPGTRVTGLNFKTN